MHSLSVLKLNLAFSCTFRSRAARPWANSSFTKRMSDADCSRSSASERFPSVEHRRVRRTVPIMRSRVSASPPRTGRRSRFRRLQSRD